MGAFVSHGRCFDLVYIGESIRVDTGILANPVGIREELPP